MIFECSAIILIILILSVLILKSGNKSGWGVAVLPLLVVPSGHIAGQWLVEPISRLIRTDLSVAWAGFEIFTLAVACLLLGLIASQIKSKRARLAYLIVCGSFSVLLTCVLLVRMAL